MYRYKIVLYYIYYCFKIWTKPWKYFQINAKYFNHKKWIFSKYEIESHIPDKWKLQNCSIKFPMNHLSKIELEDQLWYPFFLKPEWWQNSHWIYVINNQDELQSRLLNISQYTTEYIAQKSAEYDNEFEILYTIDPDNDERIKIFSFVESKNNSWSKNCINGIHGSTTYHDVLFQLKEVEKLLRKH